MTDEEMHKLIEEAPQRLDAYMRRWLADPKFKASLHKPRPRAQKPTAGQVVRGNRMGSLRP